MAKAQMSVISYTDPMAWGRCGFGGHPDVQNINTCHGFFQTRFSCEERQYFVSLLWYVGVLYDVSLQQLTLLCMSLLITVSDQHLSGLHRTVMLCCIWWSLRSFEGQESFFYARNVVYVCVWTCACVHFFLGIFVVSLMIIHVSILTLYHTI